MAWYKNKQRDVRTVLPDEEGYDSAVPQVAFMMDDGTEEIVDATTLGTGELPPTDPPVARKAAADKAAHEKSAHEKAERDKATAHK